MLTGLMTFHSLQKLGKMYDTQPDPLNSMKNYYLTFHL